jgi:hypothetical protein
MASSATRTEVGLSGEAVLKAISPMRRAPRESAATPDRDTGLPTHMIKWRQEPEIASC